MRIHETPSLGDPRSVPYLVELILPLSAPEAARDEDAATARSSSRAGTAARTPRVATLARRGPLGRLKTRRIHEKGRHACVRDTEQSIRLSAALAV